MANRREQIIKELSPDFPKWTYDLQDFLIWQNYGILEPETPDILDIDMNFFRDFNRA